MRISGLGVALVATLAYTAPLAAQQPAPAPAKPGAAAPAKAGAPAPGMMMTHMRQMDSLQVRLDSAAARMNRSTGEARVAAMADVLNALVAEHKMMHAHMQEMSSHMGAMGGMAPMARPKPMAQPMPGMARPDSAPRPPK